MAWISRYLMIAVCAGMFGVLGCDRQDTVTEDPTIAPEPRTATDTIPPSERTDPTMPPADPAMTPPSERTDPSMPPADPTMQPTDPTRDPMTDPATQPGTGMDPQAPPRN